MAVPKRKTSQSRRDQRRAHTKLEIPGMSKCPNCGELRKSHYVCPSCGYYDGKDVLSKPKNK